MRHRIRSGLAVLLAIGFPTLAVAQPAAPATRPLWEYRIVLEGDGATPMQQLNVWGAQGWELVSVVCTAREGGETRNCFYYFKRRK